jgi:hypothetical protein
VPLGASFKSSLEQRNRTLQGVDTELRWTGLIGIATSKLILRTLRFDEFIKAHDSLRFLYPRIPDFKS